jgi:hypothetical protein
MPVGLSNRDLQSHLDSLKKSVVVKFQLTVASLCRIHVVSKKVATESTLQITLKFLGIAYILGT